MLTSGDVVSPSVSLPVSEISTVTGTIDGTPKLFNLSPFVTPFFFSSLVPKDSDVRSPSPSIIPSLPFSPLHLSRYLILILPPTHPLRPFITLSPSPHSHPPCHSYTLSLYTILNPHPFHSLSTFHSHSLFFITLYISFIPSFDLIAHISRVFLSISSVVHLYHVIPFIHPAALPPFLSFTPHPTIHSPSPVWHSTFFPSKVRMRRQARRRLLIKKALSCCDFL